MQQFHCFWLLIFMALQVSWRWLFSLFPVVLYGLLSVGLFPFTGVHSVCGMLSSVGFIVQSGLCDALVCVLMVYGISYEFWVDDVLGVLCLSICFTCLWLLLV